MLGTEAGAPEDGQVVVGDGAATVGVAGIEHFARELPGWAKRADVLAVASFNASCIEKFGNGGGNFRRLYAGFLDWARGIDTKLVPAAAPELARRAADGWTAASYCLHRVSEDGPAPELFDRAAEHMGQVATTERQLFEGLANA